MTEDHNSGSNLDQSPNQRREAESTELVTPSESKPATADDLQKVQKEMSGFERAILRWTRVNTLIVLATGLFISFQWYEMHAGGEDTHALAEAAKNQAEKAETISNHIQQAANAMDTSNRQAKDALDKTLASTSAKFRQQVRPYVIVETTRLNRAPTENVILGIESVVENTGATPALNFRVSHTFNLQTKLPCNYEPVAVSQSEGDANIGSGLKRAVRVFGQRGLLKQEVMAIEQKVLFVCYSAVFQYDDIFGQTHKTEACSFYQPPAQGAGVGQVDLFLYACPKNNRVK